MNADIEKRFDALTAQLKNASDEVRTGRNVALGTLEKDVALLCRDVMNMGPEIAHSFKRAIADAIEQLDELAADIAAFKNNLEKK